MNIPHFTMYEVLNLSTKAKIQELLDVETTLANMPEVLKENITAIPSNNLYEKIMNFIASVEKSLNIFISHKKKVELFTFSLLPLIGSLPMKIWLNTVIKLL